MSIAPQTFRTLHSSLRRGSIVAALLAAPLWLIEPVRAEGEEAIGFERTPPRLSLIDGEASFWRPGAEEWTVAQINTPLASGDELYTGGAANLEIQIGARAFVRAGGDTQLGVYALEPDYLQLRVTDGDVSLDLRNLAASQTIEVATPNAAFTVERAGYYRITVDGPTSTFISRRGGQALVTAGNGASTTIGTSERIVVSGIDSPDVATYAAADIDTWDRWNYSRTDRQVDSASARYVSQDVYGLADLDQYGDWRQEPTYGSVWVPRRVAVGWAPYSDGRWLYDPFYGWSWIDYSPWGWAPFHYGRWVQVSGAWGWCPGPVVVRPYYAPALVAFYGAPGLSVGVSFGAPFGWVALGWGEPLAPWWGPAYFRRTAYWAGWGGPRYINNVHIHKTTVVHVDRIKHHDHARKGRGVVVVDRDNFGRRRGDAGRWRRDDRGELRPVHGDVPIRPRRESLQPGDRPGRRPSRELLDRRVVSTREPRITRVAVEGEPGGEPRVRGDGGRAAPAPRIVQPTRQQPVREARRGAVANVDAGAATRGTREAPPRRDAAGAVRAESRAQRYQDEARSRVERSLNDGRARSAAPSAAERERGREVPPIPSRDSLVRNAPRRDDASQRRAQQPTRETRRAPDVAVREPRREAPPPVPRAGSQRVERSAPSSLRDEVTRLQQQSRAPRNAPPPASNSAVRGERRRSEPSAGVNNAPAARARREAPSYRQPERVQRQRVETTAKAEPRTIRQSAPTYRGATTSRPERSGSSMRVARPQASAPQRAMRGGSIGRSDAGARMPRFGGGMSGGAVRGERRGGDGRR